MGPVALMAVQATELALADAGLLGDAVSRSGTRRRRLRILLRHAAAPSLGFAELMTDGSSRTLNATSYIQMMSHTAPVNIGVFFGLTGRIITTSSACTSGSQGIGYAYEAIRWGKADVMIAGGAEELDVDHGGGVRHAVRDLHAQRPAARRRRGPSIATATAW